MCGKRAAGEVSGITASSAEIPATTPGRAAEQISAEPVNHTDQESRWWLQVAIDNFRWRALYDTGASRTVTGAVGLQLASALGRPVMPSYGRRAKVVGGQTATIAGYVELPFEVAGVKRDIRVAVIPDDKVDCYLGANFVKAFGTIHDPIEKLKNALIWKSRGSHPSRRSRYRRLASKMSRKGSARKWRNSSDEFSAKKTRR